MQDEHGFLELHGIDGAICTTSIVFDSLKHSGAPEALKHLGRIVLIPGLSEWERITELRLTGINYLFIVLP